MLKKILNSRSYYGNKYKDMMDRLYSIMQKATATGDMKIAMSQIESLSSNSIILVFKNRALLFMKRDLDRLDKWKDLTYHIKRLMLLYMTGAQRLFQNLYNTRNYVCEGLNNVTNIYYFYSCAFIYSKYKDLLETYKEIVPEQLYKIKDTINKELHIVIKAMSMDKASNMVMCKNCCEFGNTIYTSDTIELLNSYLDNITRITSYAYAYDIVSSVYNVNGTLNSSALYDLQNNTLNKISNTLDLINPKNNSSINIEFYYSCISIYYQNLMILQLIKQIKEEG